jgi:hypothetical protein
LLSRIRSFSERVQYVLRESEFTVYISWGNMEPSSPRYSPILMNTSMGKEMHP